MRPRLQECDRAGAWLQVRNTQGQEGGFCKVGLRLKAYPDNPIQCVASACQFKEGSGKIQCKNAQCACGQGTCPGAPSSSAGQFIGSPMMHALSWLWQPYLHAVSCA